MHFIEEEKIQKLLSEKKFSEKEFSEILEKALNLKGLSLEETALLLNLDVEKNSDEMQKLFSTAKKVKEKIYGSRLVLFAPLYLSNFCENNCLYCAFRKDNKELIRRTLNLEEIEKETSELLKQGQKRLLLVTGEHSEVGIDFLEKAIQKIYGVKIERNGKAIGEIRRVNVNCAPLSLDEFKRLKSFGIGTYQLFQETYHSETFKKVHPPETKKSNYEKRLFAMDLAQKAGIDDIGIGVLFGLYDYRFEVLALLQHAMHLEKEFGVGSHTISIPRIESALNAPLSKNLEHAVSDADFKKLVAVLRLAVPYTGLILTTREKADFRDEVFSLGISQISAGSRTSPGGYERSEQNFEEEQQFELHDSRNLREIVLECCEKGHLPSFCTACYRTGRTGKNFMDLAKPGEIQNFCLPNALLTFKEYLLDFCEKDLQEKGEELIDKELQKIPKKEIREKTFEKLNALEKGKRDLFF